MSAPAEITRPPALNARVADKLDQLADLLTRQASDGFRVGAYRRAAAALRRLDTDVGAIVKGKGESGLLEIEGVGRSIAAAIREIVTTGRWAQLERLRGTLAPERLFQTVPGIGPQLARAIHDSLHVETLEALEVAAHDGRLATVAGIGRRRAAAIRSAIAELLARVRPPRRPIDRALGHEPAVAQLLAVDRDYRARAAADELPKIVPRRFNPTDQAWLPVMHDERDGWRFTALFSNTARAHDLGRVFDWVVIYFSTDDEPEGQRTVVTELRGELAGRRVVRGREDECRAYYRATVNSTG